jgi:hypothetical protein
MPIREDAAERRDRGARAGRNSEVVAARHAGPIARRRVDRMDAVRFAANAEQPFVIVDRRRRPCFARSPVSFCRAGLTIRNAARRRRYLQCRGARPRTASGLTSRSRPGDTTPHDDAAAAGDAARRRARWPDAARLDWCSAVAGAGFSGTVLSLTAIACCSKELWRRGSERRRADRLAYWILRLSSSPRLSSGSGVGPAARHRFDRAGGVPPDKRGIHQLLTHTSGLPSAYRRRHDTATRPS